MLDTVSARCSQSSSHCWQRPTQWSASSNLKPTSIRVSKHDSRTFSFHPHPVRARATSSSSKPIVNTSCLESSAASGRALSPGDVAVLYVDQDESGCAKVQRIRLNEEGDFLDEWPEGFFEERLDEIFGEGN